MAQQPNLSIQNNFIAGLKTQYTGLNYPENATTDSQNAIYTLTGDVTRRLGMDYETNFTTDTVNRTGLAMSSYKWNNAGGDGQSQLIVRQVGGTLSFFLSSSATLTSPLSAQKLSTSVNIAVFQAPGNVNTVSASECTYADGNGYLIVYHKDCDPFYCTFSPGTLSTATVVANRITIQIRDFFGIYPEPGNPAVTARPTSLTASHSYNLRNQGWTAGQLWSGSQTVGTGGGLITPIAGISTNGVSISSSTGSFSLTIQAGLPVQIGQLVTINYNGLYSFNDGGGPTQGPLGWGISGAAGNVTAYTSGSGAITINITTAGSPSPFTPSGSAPQNTSILQETITIAVAGNVSTISTWQTALGNLPSNADVWWRFKVPTTGVFSPSGVSVQLPNSQASNGLFIYNAFSQLRSAISGVAGLTSISTPVRTTNGCWFQGRAWYTGVNASQVGAAEIGFYTWTENIYFSRIIQNTSQFGYCYQQNDPTDEDFFDILPDDGGVITIQGSGQVYKLFPVQNGLLVFAANGIWFITGSQGIGFSATDYTVTKISGIQSISSTSYINVMGYPMFWNEEGIYLITPGQNGVLQVDNLALDTVLSLYNAIPLQSKKFARGDYNPITYQVQWLYRSTNESSVTDRYQYDRMLVFNAKTKAFYYYTLPTGTVPFIHDIRYVAGPGGSTSAIPVFKYLTSILAAGPTYTFTWSEEKDSTTFKDWTASTHSTNYVSYFIAGYNLHGKAYARWQPTYVYVFLRNGVQNSYKIQGQWDFSIAGNSGKFSTVQVINDTTNTSNFNMAFRRHKVRGHGLAFQLKIQSVDGKPFDIMGWSMFEGINQGV